MKKTKKITLETISESLNDVAEAVRSIIANMVTKKEFNERLSNVDKRFDAMDERFDDLEAEVSPHGRRLDRLEDKVRQINTKIGLK